MGGVGWQRGVGAREAGEPGAVEGPGEVMHPGVGPVVEAEQLYVRQSRLAERLREERTVVVFDVGLGAGSN
ncbi:MAG TPA: hypothetical protein VHL80_03310, partial [Polyangia bacterium]|nr:hypothetical protein [Polyangia bacterium]